MKVFDLANFFCLHSPKKIKSNIGHTEPSSGIAGVMKVVLALEKGIIPRNVGYETLNPQSKDIHNASLSYTNVKANLMDEVDLKDDRLKIVTENLPWPKASIRRASVGLLYFFWSHGCISELL